MQPASPWTADEVGRRLIDAFRLLPDRPVMSSARGFRIDDVEVEPFGWPERFVPELRDRRAVMVWASCRAARESVAERMRDLGWPAHTVERRRRAALAAIAAGLTVAVVCDGMSVTEAASVYRPGGSNSARLGAGMDVLREGLFALAVHWRFIRG